MTDVSKDLQLQKLTGQLRFLEALLDELPTPIFAKTADGRFCFFNKAYEQFFDVDRHTLLGKTVLDLEYLSLESRERFYREDMYAIENTTEVHYETMFNTSEGPKQTLYWSKGICVSSTGEKGLIGNLVDISAIKQLEATLSAKLCELKDAQRALLRLSYTDSLTGVLNVRGFQERVMKWIKIAEAYEQPMTLMIFDLDRFKTVNDVFGHSVGDELLKKFAEILKKNCRPKDVVARIGGDEFVVLLPMTTQKDAISIAHRIEDGVRSSCVLPDGEITTCSSGCAEFSAKESWEDCFKRADAALYHAKKRGRNCSCMYSECCLEE